jgi:hypothetical protein
MSSFFVVEPCNSSGGFEIKLRERKLDLKRCEAAFGRIGTVVGNTGVVLLAKVDKFTLSVYGSGRIMVKTAGRGKKPTRKDMDALAAKVMEALDREGAIT